MNVSDHQSQSSPIKFKWTNGALAMLAEAHLSTPDTRAIPGHPPTEASKLGDKEDTKGDPRTSHIPYQPRSSEFGEGAGELLAQRSTPTFCLCWEAGGICWHFVLKASKQNASYQV